MEEAFAGDDCHLFIHPVGQNKFIANKSVDSEGWVYLVFGNDGYDVISDYTTNLETLMAGANEIARKYE